MNREVEERIVAMYFDNQDFEKNAKTTIDTLGQLKEGLNLEDSSKGFEVFEKIGKSLKFDKAQQGLQKMKNTLSGMKGAVGNIFRIGQQPLQEAEGAFQRLNGYISKYVGFDIAGKIVNGVENAIRQLTVAPVSAGFSQYESTMDSVKTIMSSTGESIDVVSQHLDSMTDYANKTIYSLVDMTSNLGKFTNNGVDLERSVRAMEGIANATADAGQGAQQASMAMYNISQAIGVGKMTTIDWKSLENANIATQKLKSTFLEMAALQGKIEKKVEKDGSITYLLTKDENGKKLKNSIQLTTANFREYLSKGWLDKETMLRAFEVYSGAIDENTLERWGIHDEETKKQFLELGQEALNAATQVRTFHKMMDALKESAQSGWAKTFELIFGNMEQGTQLWTRINDELDSILSSSSEKRNQILKIWAGSDTNTEKEETEIEEQQASIEELTKEYDTLYKKKFDAARKLRKNRNKTDEELGNEIDDDPELKKINDKIEEAQRRIKDLDLLISDKKVLAAGELRDDQGRSGRQILIDALLGKKNDETGDIEVEGAMQLIRNIGSAISETFGQVFGNINAEKLFLFTQKIEQGVHKVVEWFGKANDEGSRLNKLQKILKGVLSVVKQFFTILKTVWNLVKKISAPVIDFVIDAFSGVSGFFSKMGDMNLGELITHLGDGVKKAWAKVKEWFTPKDIFDESGKLVGKELPIITWLKNLWGNLKKVVKQWLTDSGLENVWTSLADAFHSVENWWNTDPTAQSIKKVFADIKNTIVGWFTPVKNKDGTEGDMPIVTFFKNFWNGVESAFNSVKEWWDKDELGIRQFFSDVWDGITGLFQQETVTITGKQGYSWTETKDSPIVSFFKNFWNGVESAFNSAKEWWDKDELGIKQFFSDVWNGITGLFKQETVTIIGKQGYSWTETKDSPIVSFFKNIWNGVDQAFAEVQEWWNDDKLGIRAFFSGVWDSVKGWFVDEVPGTGKTGFDQFLQGIADAATSAWNAISSIDWNAIGEFFSNIWNAVLGIFGGDEAKEAEKEANKASSVPIPRAILGAADMVNTITDAGTKTMKLTKSDEKKTEDRVSIFQSILNTITEFFKSVSEAAEKIKNDPTLNAFITALGHFFEMLVKMMTQVLEFTARLGKGEGEPYEYALVGIGAILAGIFQILSYRKTANLASIASSSQSFGLQFLEIAGGMALLASAISLLTAIDQGKMLAAAGILAGLGVVVAFIVRSLTALTEAKGVIPQTPAERVINNLVNTIGKVGMLAIVIGALPEIIQKIGDVKKQVGPDANIGEDILNIMLGITAAIAGISLSLALVQKISVTGLSPVATAKTIVSVLATIGVIVLALAGGSRLADLLGADEKYWTELSDKIKTFGLILGALGNVIGQFIYGLCYGGAEIQKASDAAYIAKRLDALSTMFDSSNTSGILRMSYMLKDLMSEMKTITGSELTGFSTNMDSLVSAINSIYKLVIGTDEIPGLGDPGSETYKRYSGAVDILKQLTEALSPVKGLSSSELNGMVNFVNDLASGENGEKLYNFITSLHRITSAVSTGLSDTDGLQFDKIAIIGRLYSAIQDGLTDVTPPKFDATNVVDAICDALFVGEKAIAMIVHEIVQKGIELKNQGEKNPEVQLTTDQLELLNGVTNDTSGVASMFDEAELQKVVDSVSAKMEELTKSVPSLESTFNDAGWLNFTDSNGNPLDLTQSVLPKITELETTLSEMKPIEVKITPVFSYENLTADTLMTQLGLQSVDLPVNIDGGKLKIDFEGLSNELDITAIKQKLDNIAFVITTSGNLQSQRIDSLGSHMDGIANEVARLKLYLDTGALVGGIIDDIDTRLYDRSVIGSRVGSIISESVIS